jgi:hypothetical protein
MDKEFLGIVNSSFKFTTRQPGLADDGLKRSDSDFIRVWGYRNNSYLVFIRPIVPENSVCGQRGLFSVSFEDFFSLGSNEAGENLSIRFYASSVRNISTTS